MADAPLAARMRPSSFEEFVGQGHLVGEGRALTRILSRGSLPSIILWGPAGTGKTTLAHLLADEVGADLMRLSAVSSGVADARKIMEGARDGLFRTVLFVDEVHRWSKAQQDVLLPAVEEGTVHLDRGHHREPVLLAQHPVALAVPAAAARAARRRGGCHARAAGTRRRRSRARSHGAHDRRRRPRAPRDDRRGDARMALTGLEAAAGAASAVDAGEITRDVAADAVQRRAIVYDRQGDAHYDVISAFIKSIRGSDPDAALFWLARMIEAGEDPRFIARRLIVHASEDIGMADSQALVVAVAAAHAVEHVGLPEVRLNLAHATLYLATAPKSNSVYTAIGAAFEDAPTSEPVPLHLRDASFRGAKQLGHGKGYRYPHDFPGHAVEQEYRPASLTGTRYYEPSGQGDDVAREPGTALPRVSDDG